ncbi:hypothetical protein EYR41_008098 [Orbilia oligospora]|uniref:Uncharacterized protein n=1 Tax=Orbilia oligospora TaxID=2813651 RepID=A0A7C8K441_ORBOL|nr:hypothetical protein TWF751_011424 [Orbilia oligospora]KAF3281021.1 hypothetical protein TWF132_011430 [Orbilia oligospora]TGJ66467.1 hypothetical protein EYR41_008098 [Orbilia oligospora]
MMTTATITMTHQPPSSQTMATSSTPINCSNNTSSRYTITRSTSERQTLNSLVRASALFKSAFEDGILFEDASIYKEEAYFIAYFADSFRKRPRTLSDLDVVLLSYPTAKVAGGSPYSSNTSITSGSGGVRPGSASSAVSSSSSSIGGGGSSGGQARIANTQTSTPWYHARILNGPAEFSERVVANHKAIVEISEQFISKMKYPTLLVNTTTQATADDDNKTEKEKEAADLKQKYLEEGAPASDTEKQTIIRGFYRLWLISLVYGANTIPESGERNVDSDFGRMMACYRCLGGLKYWDVKVIQILMAYLSKELKPAFWYYKRIEKVVNEGILNSNFTEAAAEEIYTSQYFNTFMTTEFPHNAASWLRHSKKPLLLSERFSTLSSVIKLTTPKHPNEESLRFFLSKDVLKWHARELQSPWSVISGKEFSENVPLKPLCKAVGDGLGHKLPDTAIPAVKKSAWLVVELGRQDSTDTDFWGGVWDDERLRGWGYCLPKFEEENLGKKAWKGHLRRLSSRLKLH